MRRSLVVFGGNGFVGTRVCALASKQGLPVVSVSRSGVAPAHYQASTGCAADIVRWEKGDAIDPSTYSALLKDAAAVIVSVGSPPLPFVDYDYQLKMNGLCVQRVAEAARDAQVPRLVVVNATMPAWLHHVAPGYYEGKRLGEQATASFVQGREEAYGVLLKPSVIFGTRREGAVPIPLGLLFGPVSTVMQLGSGLTAGLRRFAPYLLDGLLHPPVSVESVAAAAVHHAAAAHRDHTQPGLVVESAEDLLSH